jgi:branched-chain amino acid transport system ATP-binding protein
MSCSLLSASHLCAGYSTQQVLFDVDFSLAHGEVCGIIGPNGAGKSTLLRALYGLLRLRGGSVHFQGEDISTSDVLRRIQMGVSYVPQERSVFTNLTVEENLKLAIESLPKGVAVNRNERVDLAYELFPRLKERRRQFAGTMSGGEQRMVAISIGLMPRPRLLMLDEPTTGLAPLVVHDLMNVVKRLNDEFGIATIIVEQNILSMAKIANRIFILKSGRGAEFIGSPQKLTKQQVLECL